MTTPPTETAPATFGAWKVAVESGKPVAVTGSENGGQPLGLRFECAAPGRLEYVPLSSRPNIKTLWVNGMDDTQHTIPLVAGRVSGADNSMLSKQFLGSEANYKRNVTADWGMEMSIDGPEAGLQTVRMTGFSQMRSYMLANCKKQG